MAGNNQITSLTDRSVSLKWKAIGLTSLVLLIIVGVFTVSAHHQLKVQFEQQQALLDQTRVEALAGLIERNKTALLSLAGLAKAFSGVETALASENGADLISAFTLHYSELSLALGLREARFYSLNNRLLATFGEPDRSDAADAAARRWVKGVNAEEAPITEFSCFDDCSLYSVTPIMVGQKHRGAVLFAMPLAETVSSFYWVTKANIALIMPPQTEPANYSAGAWVPTAEQIRAVTNPGVFHDVLAKASNRLSLQAMLSGAVLQFGDTHFRFLAIPLDRFSTDAEGYWIIISDVSESLSRIAYNIRTNIIYGVVGLLVAEILLALLLWRPLSRLRSTAETLPLLGRGAFQAARKAIAQRRRKDRTFFSDESDILDETAVALSTRLEQLESRDKMRADELLSQANQLKHERDFIQRLLDNAQAIILTLDSELRIRKLNDFGGLLLGGFKGSQSIPGKTTFIHLLASEKDAQEVYQHLNRMIQTDRDSYQHDAAVYDYKQDKKVIAWRHSRLEGDDDDAVILSIGLDVSEQRQAARRVAWLADHDPLTDLYNRRRFQEEVRRAIAEASRFAHGGALLYLDLDQFKYVNDASGHAAGDILLKAVALTLQRTIRTTDIVSRLGGDEFAILLPQTDEAGAIELAEKVQSALMLIQVDTDEPGQRVTASIGITLFPEHGDTMHDLLATADLAMYQAKNAGRDRWNVYSPESLGREFVRSELEMKTLVEAALAEDRLFFHYQPIFDFKKGRISHLEALLRLQLPDGSLLMPGQFIGVAERTGLIREIDRFVMRAAFSELQEFARAGFDIRLSINQSVFAFDDPEFLETTQRLFNQYPESTDRLTIEVTETAAITNFLAASDILTDLRKQGCMVAIDDFGTGFSSLRYIKELPVDFIKIDGIFVTNIVDKKDDQILIKAVIEVAHMFGKKTIAEYVERRDSFDWLRDHGSDYAQGYLIGHALPRSEVEEFMRRELEL